MGASLSHYLVLSVERNATQAEITAAFTRTSTLTNTQLGGGGSGGKRGARIEEAYRVLSDPRRRAEYDKELGR